MPCPFPGMDPYLEGEYWSGFTSGFINAIAHAMLPRLLPRYEVLVEEYVYVAHEDIRMHRVKPDVTVVTGERWEAVAEKSTAWSRFHCCGRMVT